MTRRSRGRCFRRVPTLGASSGLLPRANRKGVAACDDAEGADTGTGTRTGSVVSAREHRTHPSRCPREQCTELSLGRTHAPFPLAPMSILPEGRPLCRWGTVTGVRRPRAGVCRSSATSAALLKTVAGAGASVVPLVAPAASGFSGRQRGADGFVFDNDDQRLVADQSARSITCVDLPLAQLDETVVPTAHSRPNDLVLCSDENLHFADPGSGGRGSSRASASRQLDGPFRRTTRRRATRRTLRARPAAWCLHRRRATEVRGIV